VIKDGPFSSSPLYWYLLLEKERALSFCGEGSRGLINGVFHNFYQTRQTSPAVILPAAVVVVLSVGCITVLINIVNDNLS
jgi:hypothetical protein